ncbi:hypothetical protein CEXT_132681, partial [Caerostris extrusa]
SGALSRSLSRTNFVLFHSREKNVRKQNITQLEPEFVLIVNVVPLEEFLLEPTSGFHGYSKPCGGPRQSTYDRFPFERLPTLCEKHLQVYGRCREKNIQKQITTTRIRFRSYRRRSTIGGRSKLLSEKQAALGRLEYFTNHYVGDTRS